MDDLIKTLSYRLYFFFYSTNLQHRQGIWRKYPSMHDLKMPKDNFKCLF